MAKKKIKSDPELDTILTLLRDKYIERHPRAKIEGYRYSPWSIRVRIIDPDLRGIPITARSGEAWDILGPLPDDLVGQISVLFLITPEETKTSWTNREFEDPLPSRL